PGYVCWTNSGVPPTIRSEGLTELLSDFLFNCTYVSSPNGPTAAGAAIPTVDIQLTLTASTSFNYYQPLLPGPVPVPLAGRLLADPWAEPLLFLDEPANGKRFPCDTASCICPAVGDGTGRTSYYGGG